MISLSERIRQDFETRILSGELAPDERLPTEQQLMAQYQCSRMTVHKALSALSHMGLVDRRKKAGSFVARPRVHSMVLDIPDLAAEVAQGGRRHDFRLLARQIRSSSPDWPGRTLCIDGLHLADGAPLALERREVSLKAVPEMRDADFTTQSPGSWLLAHVPWTEAETRISAAGATADEAAALGLSAHAPCLVVERRTWRQAAPVTHVRQVFPADNYELVGRFGPSGR